MDELTRSLLSGIAAFPPWVAFDESALWEALRGLDAFRGEGERAQGPFARLSQVELHTALVMAADSGLVREVEFPLGEFLVVRTPLAGPAFDRPAAELAAFRDRLESLI